ncbi:hypothetical protein J3F84DRAFT_100591 [Trichoderma pleuroticola]
MIPTRQTQRAIEYMTSNPLSGQTSQALQHYPMRPFGSGGRLPLSKSTAQRPDAWPASMESSMRKAAGILARVSFFSPSCSGDADMVRRSVSKAGAYSNNVLLMQENVDAASDAPLSFHFSLTQRDGATRECSNESGKSRNKQKIKRSMHTQLASCKLGHHYITTDPGFYNVLPGMHASYVILYVPRMSQRDQYQYGRTGSFRPPPHQLFCPDIN